MVRPQPGGEPVVVSVPRIGCDLAEADAVAGSITHFGERYLNRIFTETERRQTGEVPLRLAARFAGKEAVMKLFRPASGIGFREIEIINDDTGAPVVRLGQRASEIARDQEIGPIAISLSHEGGLGLATAITLAEIRQH